MAYFTLEELQAYINAGLGPGDSPITIDQETYETVEAYAREFIEKYTGQVFEPRYCEETAVVDDVIALSCYPVQQVVQVILLPDDVEIDPEVYLTYRWGLELLLPARGRQVKVAYNAGHSTTPAPIKKAALWLAKQEIIKKDEPEAGVQSVSAGGVSITYYSADWNEGKPTPNDEINAILNGYKREVAV